MTSRLMARCRSLGSCRPVLTPLCSRTCRATSQRELAAIEGLPVEPCNVADYERIARRRSSGAYGYFAGGAGDERTLRENVDAYRRWRLRPRALVDVSEATTATTVLGAERLDAAAGGAGRVPAHGPSGRRGRHGTRGRGRRHDHGAVDPGDRDPRGGRGGRARRAALVPALHASATAA